MACIAREKRKNRGTRYRVQFSAPGGKLLALRGWDFKSGAEDTRQRVDRLEKNKRHGEKPDREMMEWIAAIPAAWRGKLQRAGLVDAKRLIKGRPIAYHILCWWHSLKAKGRTLKHCRQVVRRIIRVARGAGLTHLSDLTTAKALPYLESLRKGADSISAQTYNHYVGAVREFGNWLVDTGRVDGLSLGGLKPLEASKVRKEARERRGLTPEEAIALFTAAENGPVRFGVPGKDRKLVYWLATQTGLRASEIRSLKVGDFDLGGDKPTVRISCRSSKNSETAVLPLPQDLAEALHTHLASKTPSAAAFHLPDVSHFSKMIKADLEAANVPIVDHAGRVLDFHATRVTRGCWEWHCRNESFPCEEFMIS